MKRMVELPSGRWISIDDIESIEWDVYSVFIFMKSGRTHGVDDMTESEVREAIETKRWKVVEI